MDSVNVKTRDLPNTFFLAYDTDLRAELVAAEKTEQGFPSDNIIIQYLGALKRSFSKDVEKVAIETMFANNQEYLIVQTHREGFYDMLPEGLFHFPAPHKNANTVKDIIRAIKERKIEENEARKFFAPFETSINQLRVQIALYENKLDKPSHFDDLLNIFASDWEIFEYLTPRQSLLFLHLIPIIHDIRENYAAVETVLELFLLLPVEIELKVQAGFRHAQPILSKMGKNRLGIDFTTGNEHDNEEVMEINTKIGPLSNKALQEFLPGGRKKKILECLCDQLLPVHLKQRVYFELANKYKTTKLSDASDYSNAVLGVDTFL